MAPILYALALLAQDAPAAAAPAPADGPMATQVPRKQDVAPLPIQGGPVAPPTDDYGYVGWCYGALSGYVDLYDKAMPEVIRIERAWPTPSTEENIKEVYPAQKQDALKSLELFRRAIEATEKASPTPIAPQGAAAIKKGRAVWTGATSVPKAQLAQFWMSWTPPAKCDETARALEARSTLFGQALSYNAAPPAAAAPVAAPEAPAPSLAEPKPEAPLAEVARAAVAEDAPGPTVDTPVAADALPPTPLEPADIDAQETASADAEGAEETAAPADSAIDALMPAGDKPASEAPAAETAPEPEPEAAPPVVETPKPAPEAARPAPTKPKPTKKPGLRDTLRGMRGPL